VDTRTPPHERPSDFLPPKYLSALHCVAFGGASTGAGRLDLSFFGRAGKLEREFPSVRCQCAFHLLGSISDCNCCPAVLVQAGKRAGRVPRDLNEGLNPMHFVNAEVGPAVGSAGTNTMGQLKRFLSRYFYFSMALLFAVLVVWGFSRTVNENLFHAAVPRPFLLWIHGAAFAGWVAFFIAQSTLVRVQKVSWHRFLGWFGVALATVMVPLGFTIAIIMARFDASRLHESGVDAFLSIPFFDMTAFGVLIALAIYWRKRPEFHRRLLFIATCCLMDAPVGRFDFVFNHNLFYLCLDLLMVLGVVRDLVVDRRVHKVYFYALPLLIVGQNLSIYMWRINPSWWRAITHRILA